MRVNDVPRKLEHELAGDSGHREGRISQGGGMGRKTLQQIANENNYLLEDLLSRLERAGIHASGEDYLRNLANQHGLHPSEIVSIINGNNEPENH